MNDKIFTIIITGILFVVTACGVSNSPNQYDNRFHYYDTFVDRDSIWEVNTNDSSKVVISLTEDITKNSIRLDTLIDDYTIIPLETNANCMIRNIDEIIVLKDRIIIVDKSKEQVAFIFSINGEFISRIGKKGRGPNEYITLRDIAVNYMTNEIILYDGMGKKLLFYNIDGRLIKNRKVFLYASNLAIINNNCYVFHQINNVNHHISGIQNYQLVFADSTQKIISKAFPYSTPKRNEKLEINNLFDFNPKRGALLFNPIFTNNIFEIKDSTDVSLKFNFSFDEMDILSKLDEIDSNDDYIDALNLNKYWRFKGILLEANNWIFTKIHNAGIIYINLKKDELISGKRFSYIKKNNITDFDNIRYHQNFFKNTIAVKDSFFVGYLWPYDIIRNNKDSENIELKGLKKTITSNDNPILQFYKFH